MGGGREDWLVTFSDSDDEAAAAADPPAVSGGAQRQSVFFDESSSSDNDEALPTSPEKSPDLSEIVGSGGGEGIFRVPLRAAVHPGRPPALELRPHPLRETQVGAFLHTIACSDSQLWAGQDSGVRFWNLADKFRRGGAGAAAGDADAAPFCESWETSPALCLMVDGGNRLVWSGHKDGRIRSWKMDQRPGDGGFREGFTWMAHRGPVLSIVFTAYGDLWSGSEGGVIMVWPWELIEKYLFLPVEERHMASLMVERGYVDLRAQVTVNGVCSLPGGDVKILLSDHSRSKVWSASYLSFALWDARTRELLKVFGIDGQIEKCGELVPSLGDSYEEDEFKSKFAMVTRKEKIQGTMNFFQRSRNALMGAADAVRRAAVKSAFGDDNRRVEAMVVTMDGAIWSGSANGALVQWDGKGNRVQETQYHQYAVQCLCSFGTRLWVGYVSGVVQVLELDGSPIGSWIAHQSPVIEMGFRGGYVFTLANHGGIRGWNMSSPGPIDNVLRSALASREALYTKIENVKILAGTWNVGQERASPDSLISWLGSAATGADIVVVGLQEVEMGAGFLAMAAAKETVGLEGSGNGQWWLEAIGKTLDEGTSFERVGTRQLAGLLIAVWARNHLRSYIGDVDVAAVPCGFGRAIGNKGAVGIRLRVYNRILCFVNCHFAAHLEAVNRRNSDFDYVYRTMVFSRASNVFSAPTASGASSSVQCQRGSANAVGIRSVDERPELAEADMIIFLGDFNYRLFGISYDEARDFISQRCFDWLREKDQLREEMKAGKVFQGMREGVIRFPPTYKFERNQAGLAGYDSSEKKRIPAWCDRILYRDSRKVEDASCSLHCPVISSISQYDACMDVTDSDHKPVRCIFNVAIARVDESVRREQFGEITLQHKKVKLLLEKLGNIPETIVSTNTIILQNDDTSVLRVTNKCGENKAFFEILCEGQTTIKDNGTASERNARGSYGFPRWLEVHPTTGIITPGNIAEVSVLHKEFHTLEEFVDGVPQNWWCEDTRDKEVMLLIRITGCFSSAVRIHRVSVRHCLSSKSTMKTDSSQIVKHAQTNVLHRSDFRPLMSSSDLVDDFCGLHT